MIRQSTPQGHLVPRSRTPMSQRAWITEDDYIGTVGSYSIENSAALILASKEFERIAEALGVIPRYDGSIFKDLVEALEDDTQMEVVTVPSNYIRREKWKGEYMFPWDIDAPPGNGYIKIVGFRV